MIRSAAPATARAWAIEPNKTMIYKYSIITILQYFNYSIVFNLQTRALHAWRPKASADSPRGLHRDLKQIDFDKFRCKINKKNAKLAPCALRLVNSSPATPVGQNSSKLIFVAFN